MYRLLRKCCSTGQDIVQSVVRPQSLLLFLYLVFVVCFCASIYDDNLTDNNDLPVCILQGFHSSPVAFSVVSWLAAVPVFYGAAQMARLISRAPPVSLHS